MAIKSIRVPKLEWLALSPEFNPTGTRFTLNNSSGIQVRVAFGKDPSKTGPACEIAIGAFKTLTIDTEKMDKITNIYLYAHGDYGTTVVAYDE